MSDKDLQFIERALAHPWMFWVYFWKWPRIVRQACAEYDLLAKERDTAKAAYERSERANKLVRDWIHVTHRLSTTPEAIRAIFAAGKRLSMLLALFVATNAFGQAPPYLRNQWTTNANPIAVKVISTNGVQAATNVWALDFTNTTSVSVNVVSNAGKVVFSFIGATNSGGSGSIVGATNLGLEMSGAQGLFMGTNNQLIELRSLVPGTMILFSTNSTNITIIGTGQTGSENLTNWSNIATGAIVAGATIWTNDGTAVMIAADTNRVRHGAMQTVFGSNDNSHVTITNGGIATIGWGQFIGETPADSVGNYTRAHEGGIASASFANTTNCWVHGWEGAFAGGFFFQSSNCTVESVEGGLAAMTTSTGAADNNVNVAAGFGFGTFFTGTKASIVTVSSSAMGLGYMETASNISVRAQSPSVTIASAVESANVDVQNKGGLSSASAYNSRDIIVESQGGGISSGLVLGSFAFATNSTLSGQSGIAVGKFSGRSNIVSATDGLAFGSVESNERISAQGGAVHALAFGRDVTSTNNWTFGIHYTNTVPLSLAVGANGTTQFRAASNSVVIRTETAPTIGQILTAKDTSGTVGWSNAPAASGGGIASIFTNNVLAGGPGLTELGFTNTATVTWEATTNAGRVTMSATSTGGSQTPWTSNIDADAFSLTDFGSQLAFTNGSKIGATAINTLTLTNAHLLFSADNTFDVGASGATRPRNGYFGTGISIGPNSSLNNSTWIVKNDGVIAFQTRSAFQSPSDGVLTLSVNAGNNFDRLQFGGTAATFPALKRSAGHLTVVDAVGSNSTNSLFFGNTVDTTATTGMTMNRQTGRVRLSAGNQTYLVTNNLATANSIVTATVNSDDTTALSVKAIPSAGIITLKVNAATTANTDISFFISAP